MSKLHEDFVANFENLLNDEGDMFFSTGSSTQDYELITGTIDRQGYWAGVRLRYYFDSNYGFLRTEERRFGNG